MTADSQDQTAQDELQLLTVEDVAGLIGVHVSTVYEWLANGELAYVSIGEGRKFVRKRITRAEVARWIEAHTVNAKAG